MAKCKSCGHSEFFLLRSRCDSCGRELCLKCRVLLGNMWLTSNAESNGRALLSCNSPCVGTIAAIVAQSAAPPSMWTAGGGQIFASGFTFSRPFRFHPRFGELAGNWVNVQYLAASAYFHSQIQKAAKELAASGKLPEFAQDMSRADMLLRAARYEESAQVYEKWHLYDDAGRARRGAQTHTVKQVSVDLNKMLDQVKSQGLAIPYKCTSCGSSLRIDSHTSRDSLKKCEHCGTAFDSMNLAEALARIIH